MGQPPVELNHLPIFTFMTLRVGHAMCLLAVHLALANLVPWGPSCGSQKECEAEASGMLALYLDRMTRGEVVWGSFFFFVSAAWFFFGAAE